MRLRYIITLLLTGSLLSGTALCFLILNVAPGTSAALPLLLSLLLFFYILGLVTAGLISWRSRGHKAWRAHVNLSVSVRQGVVISALAVLCLWLARFNILNFWLLLGCIFIAALIEYQLLPAAIREQAE